MSLNNINIPTLSTGHTRFTLPGAMLRNSDTTPDAKDWVYLAEHLYVLKKMEDLA
jgi:hypothetical protein